MSDVVNYHQSQGISSCVTACGCLCLVIFVFREKGGAYGGGAMSKQHGLFHFYSYRSVFRILLV